MIRFSLSCAEGHAFDSWFQSSAAFEGLMAGGHLSCAICGSAKVDKALMAPAVATEEATAPAARPKQPPHPAEQALAALRKKVEQSSDYVGLQFATEARAMHLGEVPDRPIYGEASRDEARQLVEDGVPVAPLPFIPRKRTN